MDKEQRKISGSNQPENYRPSAFPRDRILGMAFVRSANWGVREILVAFCRQSSSRATMIS
jgi:hypothetical protein